MTFENIQDIIGERINHLQKEIDAFESVIDLDSPQAQVLFNRKTRIEENLHVLKTIGFFLASQERELEILRIQSQMDTQRIAFLRDALKHKQSAYNAAMAMLNLYQMQRDHWSEQFQKDLEKDFSLEEIQTILPQLQKQAA